MPMFALYCVDKPDSLPLRLSVRDTHLAYVAPHPALRLGGPLLDEAGSPVGSLLIIEVEDLAAAQAWSAADPYSQAGLFERVEIRAWRYVAGQLP